MSVCVATHRVFSQNMNKSRNLREDAAGTATANDINAVSTALNNLQIDLFTTTSTLVQQTINQLNTDLTTLSISMAAMDVQS